MFRKIFMAAVLLIAAGPAFAQTATSGSTSGANATGIGKATATADLNAAITVQNNQGGTNVPHQLGSISGSVASAGTCGGGSGGFGNFGALTFQAGAGFVTPDEVCHQNEIERIGIEICTRLNDQEVCEKVKQGWNQLFAEHFKGGDDQKKQGAALPAAGAPAAVVAAVQPTCPDLPAVTHNACMAKANAGQ